MSDEKKDKKIKQVVVKGVVYDVPERLTLQDSRDVETALGSFGGKLDSVIGMIFLAMREVDPDVTGKQVLALDWDDVEMVYEESKQEDESVPPAQAAPPDEPSGVAI